MAKTRSPFTQATFKFLKDLKKNNNRDWFKLHKERYEQDVKEPMLRFIASMQKPLGRISRQIVADPSPVGGSMFRIYRDTRFASDKTPYKTHVAAQFRHVAGKDAHAPGYYFHIGADGNYVGGGIWHPDGAALALIRARIASMPKEWEKVLKNKKFREICGDVSGGKLVRPPRGYSDDERYLDYIKLKDFFGGVDLPTMLVIRPGLQEEVLEVFRAASPLMKFICDSLGLPW
jgi:uncharacterized protein (TIGR02453 family)